MFHYVIITGRRNRVAHRALACQAGGPGSNPVWDKLMEMLLALQLWRFSMCRGSHDRVNGNAVSVTLSEAC